MATLIEVNPSMLALVKEFDDLRNKNVTAHRTSIVTDIERVAVEIAEALSTLVTNSDGTKDVPRRGIHIDPVSIRDETEKNAGAHALDAREVEKIVDVHDDSINDVIDKCIDEEFLDSCARVRVEVVERLAELTYDS